MSTRTLDYGSHLPFVGALGQPRHLAWPVHAYRVTIPAVEASRRDDLNPFERVVLEVLSVSGALSDERLAEETCIPLGLVKGVLNRLRDRGLISADNMVTGKQSQLRGAEDRPASYASAMVFRELVGGKLLPYVHVLGSRTQLATKEADRFIKRVDKDDAARRLGPPTARDIIDIVTRTRKRAEAYGQALRVPAMEQIRVAHEPENYLLDCPIAIQGNDADFRIADPFGWGFARDLEREFSHRLGVDARLQEWMSGWTQSLVVRRPEDNEAVAARGAFETDHNWRYYPELMRMLRPSRGNQYRSVSDLYGSLEWALYYCCETHGPAAALRRLGAEKQADYPDWLAGIASRIGFETSRYAFRPIPPGRLADYQSHQAEMATVLAIAIVQADTNSAHPLHRIALNMPDLLERIRALAEARGQQLHGSRVDVAQDGPLQSDDLVQSVVTGLLPSVRFDGQMPHADDGGQADLRLEARTSLVGRFGYATFGRLGPNAQAALLHAEEFWLRSSENDDARAFVASLYAALQAVFRELDAGTSRVDVAEREYTRQANAAALRAGLGALPNQFRGVNVRRIQETLQGRDHSVGASVVALLLTASDDVLHEIAAIQPDFLESLAKLTELRGHGNQPVHITTAELKSVRDSAITAVVTLLELNEGD